MLSIVSAILVSRTAPLIPPLELAPQVWRTACRVAVSHPFNSRGQVMIRIATLSVLYLSSILVLAAAYSFIPG